MIKGSWIRANVFQPYCARCHSNSNPDRPGHPAADLDLTDREEVRNAGDLIYNTAVMSREMPKGKSMPDPLRHALRQWIDDSMPE